MTKLLLAARGVAGRAIIISAQKFYGGETHFLLHAAAAIEVRSFCQFAREVAVGNAEPMFSMIRFLGNGVVSMTSRCGDEIHAELRLRLASWNRDMSSML